MSAFSKPEKPSRWAQLHDLCMSINYHEGGPFLSPSSLPYRGIAVVTGDLGHPRVDKHRRARPLGPELVERIANHQVFKSLLSAKDIANPIPDAFGEFNAFAVADRVDQVHEKLFAWLMGRVVVRGETVSQITLKEKLQSLHERRGLRLGYNVNKYDTAIARGQNALDTTRIWDGRALIISRGLLGCTIATNVAVKKHCQEPDEGILKSEMDCACLLLMQQLDEANIWQPIFDENGNIVLPQAIVINFTRTHARVVEAAFVDENLSKIRVALVVEKAYIGGGGPSAVMGADTNGFAKGCETEVVWRDVLSWLFLVPKKKKGSAQW